MTGTGQLAHDAEVRSMDDLTRFLLPDEPAGPPMAQFGFVSWLLHTVSAAGTLASDDFGRLLRNWPGLVISWQLWHTVHGVMTAGELERLRAQIWAPERPAEATGVVPTRHEVITLARNYSDGRALPGPAAATAGPPAGEPSRPA